MNERTRSRFGLILVFSLAVFANLSFNLAITNVIILLLLKAGILHSSIYQNPAAGFLFIVLISLIIGLLTNTLCSKILITPIRKVLVSMKELANGNFNIRIHINGLLSPKEFTEFSDEFNSMAKELGSIQMLRYDFVNNFTHEFKTPIVSLRGFAKLLKKGGLTLEEREEYLNIIIRESDRLSALAANILNLSKIEKQKIITEKCTYDLSEQIRLSTLLTESKWMEKDLDLEIDMEEISYYGNEELLNIVWLNVLDNAVKFSYSGGKLQVKLLNMHESIIFMVRDFGCGMDEETKEHIFDKFYQGDTSHTTEGNGIGMALVKKIVSLHQGHITVDSHPGKGTLVTVFLPNLSAPGPCAGGLKTK